MKKHKWNLSKFSIQVLILLILTGCGTTKIVNSWKSDQLPDIRLKQVAVIALIDDIAYRRAFENAFTSELQNLGVESYSGLNLFPLDRKYSKEEMDQILNDKNVEAIIIVTTAGSERTKEYVPENNYPPYSMYNYYGYYNYNYYDPYRYNRNPGYYRETQIQKIEAVIFDRNTDKLIWTAKSQTTNPGSLIEFAKDVSTTLIKKMKEDRVVK